MVINLPDTVYGFVIGDAETQLKQKFFFSSVTNIFIAVQSRSSDNIKRQQLLNQLHKLNPDLEFNFLTWGWVNDQYNNNRKTIKLLVRQKPFEQLKLNF